MVNIKTYSYSIGLIFILLMFFGCGAGGSSSTDSTAGVGSIGFALAWESPDGSSMSKSTAFRAPSIDVCTDYGITTINAYVINSANSTVTSGSWACSDHGGSHSAVPAGSNYMLRVEAVVSGAVKWRGEVTGISIVTGQTTNLGQITMSYIGNDTTPPTVSSTSPASYATSISVNSTVTATFSEEIAHSSLDTTTFTLSNGTNQINGTVSYDQPSMTATFTPISPLSYATTYTATLTTGVKDMAGNNLQSAYTWTFTTGSTPDTTPPTVLSTSPANSATGVSVNTAITATFSETMTASTVSTATFTLNNGVTGTVTYSGTTATFTPSGNLAYSTTYTATITTGVKDSAGNAMSAAYTWTFTTGTAQASGTIFSRTAIGENIPLGTATNFYQYYFMGYASLNPPQLPNLPNYWVATQDFNKVRVKKISGTATCADIGYAAGFTNENGNGVASIANGTAVGEYCDFQILFPTPTGNVGTVPQGTHIAAIYFVGFNIGTYVLDGSSSNIGRSVNGYNSADTAGGFAFQFCSGTCDGNFSTSRMPDTNQTTSYTDTFGEDHDYTINPPSYTDNGDGTVTDNVTGLMWQKQDDATARTWDDAGAYCDASTLGGYSDWRLPSRIELVSIVDYGIYNPSINATYFLSTNFFSAYWSSIAYASSTSNAWYLSFDNGHWHYNYKTSSFYVRCVRGGQATSSLTDNGNGTVTDSGTLLMWQQGEISAMTWEAALSNCEGLNLAGQTDWRLPNVKELSSVVDDTRYNPAINTTLFPNAISSFYWSSTTRADDTTSLAWSVCFSNDCSGNDGKTNFHYVRCVRGGQ